MKRLATVTKPTSFDSLERAAKLILPDPISQKEIDLVWKQLGAYKTLLETMTDTGEETGASPSQ